MRILLAEDERPLSRAIVKILEKNHYSADAVYNGKDALSYIELGNYDAAILDIMMPEKDGISVLRELRRSGNNIPVLLLTARAEVDDRVLGLDSGANYYLTKPFDARELLAIIRGITRTAPSHDTKRTVGNLTLDLATFELSTPTSRVRLTNKEFQIMEIFMSSPHHVISTERLMERIWGYDAEAEINVVWVYISYLRKKLGALEASVRIKASRNAGYSLEEYTKEGEP
ncbi:MAG: response regulator transcription factor [Clostridia bacterium]|nr:response regulator transcription factor [Clostridia bacterium]MBQ7339179.1 response regulator transcription factor [Clostridia bacterium]